MLRLILKAPRGTPRPYRLCPDCARLIFPSCCKPHFRYFVLVRLVYSIRRGISYRSLFRQPYIGVRFMFLLKVIELRARHFCAFRPLQVRNVPTIAVAPNFLNDYAVVKIRVQRRTLRFFGIVSSSLLVRADAYLVFKKKNLISGLYDDSIIIVCPR